jgi:uncharacterized protein
VAHVEPVVRRWIDAVPVPWRNGGGLTRELVREPASGDGFDWRVSVAQVDFDGPFSTFEGYDRILVLLSGDGLDLHVAADASVVALRPPFGLHRFAGELVIHATLPVGATTDFNLMWRRDVVDADVRIATVRGAQAVGAGLTVVFVADGDVRIGGHALGVGDLARFEGTQRVEGSATLFVCSLRPPGH